MTIESASLPSVTLVLTAAEAELLLALRQRPALRAPFQHLLQLTQQATGPWRTADVVEAELRDALRQLGQLGLSEWAQQAEQRTGAELRAQDSTARCRKHKTLRWWSVFGEVSAREQIWSRPGDSYVRLLPTRLGVTSRGCSRPLARVLTDFGCEHSFVAATHRVREHYGFVIGPSAVRTATLAHARRALAQLAETYAQPFRALPATGAAP